LYNLLNIYAGHKIDAEGLCSLPDKVQAIEEAAPPPMYKI